MQDDYLNDNADDDVYGQPSGRPSQRSSTNWGLIIGIIAGVGLLGALLCCGIGWYMFKFGTDVMAEQVGADLQDNATIEERIGTIQSISLDLSKSAATEGDMVFRVEGDKGSGFVTFTNINEATGTVDMNDGTLRMDSGETFPLAQEESPAPDAGEAAEQPGDEPEGTDE